MPDTKQPVKILGDGEVLARKLTITAKWFTKGALEKINKAGGKALNPKGEAFTTPKPKDDLRQAHDKKKARFSLKKRHRRPLPLRQKRSNHRPWPDSDVTVCDGCRGRVR